MGVVASNLSEKAFKNTYLLYGSEAYLRNYYKTALKNALANPDDTLNYAYFEGTGTNPDEVADLVETMPFLAEHRVVIVENSGWFAKAGSDGADDDGSAKSGKFGSLLNSIKNISEDVILIFAEENVDKRSKLYKAVATNGVCEEYAEQTADMLAKWISNQVKSEGKSIDAQTAYYLVSEVGHDMLLLQNELSKLLAWCLERDRITMQDVDTVCTHQINTKIFDMISAIAAHRREEALRLYYDLLTLRESPFHILSLLVRQYSQMLMARDCMDHGEGAAIIATKLGIKDWLAKKLIDSVRRISKEQLKMYLEACAQADEDIKTGNITDMMSIELLIVSCSQK